MDLPISLKYFPYRPIAALISCQPFIDDARHYGSFDIAIVPELRYDSSCCACMAFSCTFKPEQIGSPERSDSCKNIEK